jgi:hypothetical protein
MASPAIWKALYQLLGAAPRLIERQLSEQRGVYLAQISAPALVRVGRAPEALRLAPLSPSQSQRHYHIPSGQRAQSAITNQGRGGSRIKPTVTARPPARSAFFKAQRLTSFFNCGKHSPLSWIAEYAPLRTAMTWECAGWNRQPAAPSTAGDKKPALGTAATWVAPTGTPAARAPGVAVAPAGVRGHRVRAEPARAGSVFFWGARCARAR